MFGNGIGGISANVVDYESALLNKVGAERPLEKLQLHQRPFITVPYLGRGNGDPTLESQLQQGENISEKKSVSRYVPKIEQPETLFSLVKKKPITPSQRELKENIPSRSAKLRYVIKKRDFYDFDNDVFKKFKTLLEIENFGRKL